MLSVKDAEARAAALVEAARKAGADAADALYVGDASTGVQVRLGELEDVERSEGETIGLRFFLGSRSATASSSDLSADALRALVERTAAMAREAPEDPYAGLAPEEMLLRGPAPDVEGDDGADPHPAELKQRALILEEAARAVAGVTNSEGAGLSAGRTVIGLATSHGFCRGYSTSGYSASASVIAGTGTDMQRDYDSHSVRHLADLDDPEVIGRRAGERAVARLNPSRMESGIMPVLFDSRVGGSLVGHLIGAITGSAIARRTSFLVGREDTPTFPSDIVITDDPLRKRGLRSKPFDGEGLPTAPRNLVEDGRVTGWLMESASARQLGMTPTGHASRGVAGSPGVSATNLTLLPGSVSRAELMADVKLGLYVTELIGQGVNGVTGDYSRGASGFLIEKGEITRPVQEITIAGNLLDMYRTLRAADDLEYRRSTNVPTLRVEGLTVAGA
jgi:PmbA protein